MNRVIALLIVILIGCSKKIYTYKDVEYYVYTEIVGNLDEIKALDLSGNTEKIPSEVFMLENLVFLSLSNKDLDSLPSDICNLTSLKILILNNNKNIVIPNCFYLMDNLEVVSIFNCNLNKIPSGFGSMINLETLIIDMNKYSSEEVELLKLKLPNTRIMHH